jgi:glycosyltransferase involved in cell wall biosynthesis
MRVVILTDTYSKTMGYATHCLPKALSGLGVDVHVVTTELPPYYNLPEFEQTYGRFAKLNDSRPAAETVDGYNVHYLPYRKRLGHIWITGLRSHLKRLRPDIVQTFAVLSWVPFQAALGKLGLRYRLFTGSHTTASVFPLAQRSSIPWWDMELWKCRLTRTTSGRFVSLLTTRCYAATRDCADVAVRFFGVPQRKIDVCPLGVDTDVFFPVTNVELAEDRERLRGELGFGRDEIVCVYSGRFSDDKNPLALAQAVAKLATSGQRFRALFLGDGIQADAIRKCQGCVTRPFVAFKELGAYYRAADIGVWPTQESTSMLDAAACGLPVVVNDTLAAVERIEGNGITYRLNDVGDLCRALLSLRNAETRRELGDAGAVKMTKDVSWRSIAERRLRDYKDALSPRQAR